MDLNHARLPIPPRGQCLVRYQFWQASRQMNVAIPYCVSAQPVLPSGLNAMERDGQIGSDGSGFYALADHSGFISGRVSSHRDGYGFVIPDEPGEDLYLSEREMQKVMHGDRVLAKVVGLDRR